MSAIHPARVRCLKEGPAPYSKPICYWMSRDQRARDNFALSWAQAQAQSAGQPLFVAFCLTPSYPGATTRSYSFMISGLRETADYLRKKGIPFFLLYGDPPVELGHFIETHSVGMLVTDFDPLRIKKAWKQRLLSLLKIPVHEIDAHNIVPCWAASDKQEYGAYTLRPKLQRLLPDFLDACPPLPFHPFRPEPFPLGPDWSLIQKELGLAGTTLPSGLPQPGETAAMAALSFFLKAGLPFYAEKRNDPSLNGQSGLSPYLHFGQLSAHHVMRAVLESPSLQGAQQTFLEELFIRRELSDNYCHFNPNYDNTKGFPAWARETLSAHAADRRGVMYDLDSLESAATHDPAWNAAQNQMVRTGRMHGYMRMYWAKKILEWTPDAETAMHFALTLNDRHELDGRDPSGFTGVAWSIGGVHDRAWPERPVFGKIRYMNAAGLRRKFAMDNYIRRYS